MGAPIEIDGVRQIPPISDFKFIDQDSNEVTNATLSEYIYIADFFFTSCPSICPKVTKNMLAIYDAFKDDDRVKLVSFTLDPKRDTPDKLKLYAENLEINHDKWLFLHAEQDYTMKLAREYMVTAEVDEAIAGGIDHSGTILLVDRTGHIRSYADGTDSEATVDLIQDIKHLLTYE